MRNKEQGTRDKEQESTASAQLILHNNNFKIN
jgi:hypothetical protein